MKTYNWEGVNPDGYFLDKLEPIPSALDRKSGSAGMPRPTSYAVLCLKKKIRRARLAGRGTVRREDVRAVLRQKIGEVDLAFLYPDYATQGAAVSRMLDGLSGRGGM